jgi:ferredoxin
LRAARADGETQESQLPELFTPDQEGRPVMKAVVDRAGCFGCGACTTVCKFGAITVDMSKAAVDLGKCTGCGLCVDKCAVKVISMRFQY